MSVRLAAANDLGFGTERLPPAFHTWPAGAPLTGGIAQLAAEVLAFDCLLQNSDRRPTNPNLLTDGTTLAMFDHELALFPGLFFQGAWAPGALTQDVASHLFGPPLMHSAPSFSRFEGAWAAISDARLLQYAQSVPMEWVGVNTADGGIALIRDVRDHLQACIQELTRALQ